MSIEPERLPGLQEDAPEPWLQLELQLKALEIIDEILSDTTPEEADARRALKWHVAHHPGQPQRALLMHMITLPRSDSDHR
ncbi:hypothetical protein [Arthrobacter sp. D3-16]